jgi:hypothetical protein
MYYVEMYKDELIDPCTPNILLLNNDELGHCFDMDAIQITDLHFLAKRNITHVIL